MPFNTELRNDGNLVQTSFDVAQIGTLRVLWWPPKHPDSEDELASILVFTCGNPGIPEWYIDLLTRIRDANPTVAIAACGHIGHAHDLPRPPQHSLTLESQVEAHSAVLQALSEQFPNARFVSLSHSIGGYISMRVARRFPDKITHLIALQPTISNLGQTPNGRVMKHFFVEPVRSVLAFLGAFLVQAFPFLLSILFSSWPKSSIKHLKDFVASSATSLAAMTMASDEMVFVAELDTTLLVELRQKLRIVYSETGDLWVGTNSDEVIRVMGKPDHVTFAPIPHAFCLNHNAETAEACMPWIKQAFKAHEKL